MSDVVRRPGGEGRSPADPMAIAAATDGRAKGGTPQGRQDAPPEAPTLPAPPELWPEGDALKLESRQAPPANPFESLLRAKAAERGQVLRLRDPR